jgi:hypothetical protein
MEKYLVIYLLQSEVGKLADALNNAARMGYVFKSVVYDSSQRTVVIMELEEEKVRKPRIAKEL